MNVRVFMLSITELRSARVNNYSLVSSLYITNADKLSVASKKKTKQHSYDSSCIKDSNEPVYKIYVLLAKIF